MTLASCRSFCLGSRPDSAPPRSSSQAAPPRSRCRPRAPIVLGPPRRPLRLIRNQATAKAAPGGAPGRAARLRNHHLRASLVPPKAQGSGCSRSAHVDRLPASPALVCRRKRQGEPATRSSAGHRRRAEHGAALARGMTHISSRSRPATTSPRPTISTLLELQRTLAPGHHSPHFGAPVIFRISSSRRRAPVANRKRCFRDSEPADRLAIDSEELLTTIGAYVSITLDTARNP